MSEKKTWYKEKKYLIAIIIAVLVLTAVLAYLFLFKKTGQTSLKERLKRLIEELRQKKEQGYDVLKTEYILLSALYSFKHGDLDRARSLLEKAEKSLANTRLLPTIPERDWKPLDNTLFLDKVPTVEDFVPIGKVFVKTPDGYIYYSRGNKRWKLSCFIILAVGWTSNREMFEYQGRLVLAPEEGQFKPRLYIGDSWIIPDIVFTGPLYFDDGEKFGHPTVYQYDLSGKYLQYLTYIPEKRTWIHVIRKKDGEILLNITMKAEGRPMWIGDWDGHMLIHGVYPKKKDYDIWSGFWDMGEMNATINVNGITASVRGFMVFDRATHRTMLEEKTRNMGPPLAFSCMVIWQKNITILVTHSENPSPESPQISFEHQLVINLLDRGVSTATTNFTLTYSKDIQPSEFNIIAHFPEGSLNITGRVFMFWPEKWVIGRGTWWNSSGIFAWGRAFLTWTGTLTFNGKIYRINAVGCGEYTRFSEKAGAFPETCPKGGDCWGRWGSGEFPEP
ncbi:MAG: hypothetical protein DRJ35_07565 [Thermoprotei archaeon]|nr:MAG: hypothetical protein DRJ35_07565 [Thermoprotei archaeon]